MRSFSILLFAVVLFTSLSLAGEPMLFRFDDSHSFVGFNVKYLKLVQAEGRFNFVRGAFFIDTADVTKSSFTAIIKTESVNTANEGRDEDLRGEDFFDVQKYPTIIFQSKKIEKQGNGYSLTGLFTMHGVTKEITMPMTHLGTTLDQRGTIRVGFESKSSLSRSAFGVSGSAMAVDDEVFFTITALTVRQNLDSIRPTSFGGKKAIAALMNESINAKGVKEAIEQYKSLKADTTYDASANQLGMLIMRLADKGKAKDAIEVAKLGVEMFPNDTQQYFRLGYAYQKDGNKESAKEQYKKALELDAFNASAMEMWRLVE